MVYLAVLLVAFSSGIAGGRLLHPGPVAQRVVGHVQRIGVVALVFLMGLSLGADASFWVRIGPLGLDALIFGILTALGGGFGAMFTGRWIERRRRS